MCLSGYCWQRTTKVSLWDIWISYSHTDILKVFFLTFFFIFRRYIVNQKIAVGVLKKLGYDKVDVAENGLEVIDSLDRGSVYDVILVSVQLTL